MLQSYVSILHTDVEKKQYGVARCKSENEGKASSFRSFQNI